VQGRLGEEYIKQSLDMGGWEAAQERVREWEAKGTMQADVKRVTVSEAGEKFIKEELRTRHVAQKVIRKFELLPGERLKHSATRKVSNISISAMSRLCGICELRIESQSH